MTTFRIPYGLGHQSVEISSDRVIGVIRPKHAEALSDLRGAVRQAIRKSSRVGSLQSLSSQDTVTIVVNDKTRPVPNREIVETLLEELATRKVMLDRIKIVVATGVHPPCSPGDLNQMLGERITKNVSIVNHSAWDERGLADVGQIGAERPIRLQINRHVAEASVRILVGLISPHHAAGYSGGRKSILPGVASFENIRNQHNLHPDRIMLGKVEDNPFHLLAMEAARKLGATCIVNVVLNGEGKVAEVVAGDLVEAWQEGVAFCNDLSKSVLPDYSDIVITSPGGYPRDINLWQSQKAISSAELIVRPGGVIILVAECKEGVGSDDLRRWLTAASTPEEIIQRFDEVGFTGGSRKAYYFARALRKVQLVVVSKSLSKDELGKMHLRGAASIGEALEFAKERVGRAPLISILPHAPGLILDVEDRQKNRAKGEADQ